MQLTRLSIVINGFVDPQNVLGELSLFHHVAPACYFEVLRLFSGFVAICNVVVIITERLIATIQIRNYEQKSHTLIVFLVLLGTSICGVFGVNIMYKSYKSLMQATGLVALMILYVAVTFRICEVLLSRQIRNSNGVQSGGYTLSQRYQMRENIQLIKLLRRTMIAFAVCTSSMAFCFVLFVYFLDDPFGNGVYLLRGSINLLIDTSSNVLVVGAITGTHVWRQDLKTKLRFFVYGSRQALHLRNALVRPSVTKVTYLRDVDGHQLNFNPRDEGRLYFEQLANAWM
ncbi:hypothetical protein M3Y96_01060800 [Aphelenchoides besseyi]|nr:hypothetical protein M3Y96_01060800 [Aphelenchoides besseyi]